MKKIVNTKSGSDLLKAVSVLALGFVLMGTITTSAYADGHQNKGKAGHDGRGHGASREWQDHEHHARHYWGQPNYEPGVIYAPPVIYSPPPQYEEPGFNLIVPLHIR